MSPTLVMFLVMIFLLAIGAPIGVALGLAMIVLVGLNPVTTQAFIAQSMYSGVANFTLIALPFFMLSGSVMETGGLSKRLVKAAYGFVGNITGGLGIITVLACMLFGAVSGSAPATVAAIGTIMIPMMVRAGYDKYYATSLVAVAGGLGIIVPPSYPMVIYGTTANVSIGSLFIAGFGPAVVVALILIAINHYFSKKFGYKGSGVKFNIKNTFKALWDAKLALLMPVIILGGIYSGAFTATEAAVVACVYGIIIGLFVYKELKLSDLWRMYKSNMIFVGGMMFTIAPSYATGAIFTHLGIPAAIKYFFFSITSNQHVVIFLMMVILFIAGMFLSTTPMIVVLTPILYPIAADLGIGPIQFGLIMVLSLAVAFVTPPVAVNLFTASSMTGLSVDKIVVRAMPFVLGCIVAMFLVAYIPEISVGLLHLLGQANAR
jgi:C4-dicarboxylate transporter DctM subunit